MSHINGVMPATPCRGVIYHARDASRVAAAYFMPRRTRRARFHLPINGDEERITAHLFQLYAAATRRGE